MGFANRGSGKNSHEGFALSLTTNLKHQQFREIVSDCAAAFKRSLRKKIAGGNYISKFVAVRKEVFG